MSDDVIDLRNISCKTGYRFLLRDITWQVKRGEHWVVFGMNGSGKTTLLSIIAGFKHYTSGTAKVFGEAFSNENILAIRKKVGWVSSSYFDKYYSKEAVLDIVLSGKTGALGLASTIELADVLLAKKLLTELKLSDKINRPFDLLSKGERQNVLIARALLANPDILILDEPCSGLDVYNRSYLFSTIEALSQKKDLTIIYVTHYTEEIMPLFSKALFLRSGHIFAQGATEALMTNEKLEAFLGYPVKVTKINGTYYLQIETKSTLVDLLEEGEQK